MCQQNIERTKQITIIHCWLYALFEYCSVTKTTNNNNNNKTTTTKIPYCYRFFHAPTGKSVSCFLRFESVDDVAVIAVDVFNTYHLRENIITFTTRIIIVIMHNSFKPEYKRPSPLVNDRYIPCRRETNLAHSMATMNSSVQSPQPVNTNMRLYTSLLRHELSRTQPHESACILSRCLSRCGTVHEKMCVHVSSRGC